MQSNIHVGRLFRPGRVEALSDGVFAIVMTLAVLGIIGGVWGYFGMRFSRP